MSDGEYIAHDELERVLGGCRLQSPLSTPTRLRGGECDPYFALPRKARYSYTNAGLIVAAPNGEKADVLASMICEHVSTVETTDDAFEWYFKMCKTYIRETRSIANKRKYKRRVERAQAKGYPGYWHHRIVREEGLD